MIIDKAYIQSLIETNDKAVVRGLMAIYSRQTEAEKNVQATVENNGIGFNGTDGEILTSFAKWYSEKGFLTPKQISIARSKMKKYWKQLLQEAAGNGYEVSYK